MATSSNRLRWLLGTTAAMVVALGLAYRWSDRSPPSPPPPPRTEEAPRNEPTAPPARPPAPAPTSAPVTAPPAGTPGAPELPPDVSATPSEDQMAIPPEAPQTVEWKLGKTELILESLGKRVQRLEKEIQEADARGDQETAKRQRILLDRSKQRMAALERDVAAMKADGGAR